MFSSQCLRSVLTSWPPAAFHGALVLTAGSFTGPLGGGRVPSSAGDITEVVLCWDVCSRGPKGLEGKVVVFVVVVVVRFGCGDVGADGVFSSASHVGVTSHS